MVKFQIVMILVLVGLVAFSCAAQRQKIRLRPLARNRQLARQEVEAAVTPYPSADELKPEVPFDEAAGAPADEPAVVEEGFASVDEPAEGAANEPIPDEVYGPPEIAILYNTPDEVYGPPEVEANLLPADMTLARQRNARQRAAYVQARLAKLRGAKPRRFS